MDVTERHGGSQRDRAALLCNLAVSRRYLGNRDVALTRAAEALAFAPHAGGLAARAASLQVLSRLALDDGDLRLAAAHAGESLGLWRQIGDTWNIAAALESAAALPAAVGGSASAVRLLGAAAALRESIAAPASGCAAAERDVVMGRLRAMVSGALRQMRRLPRPSRRSSASRPFRAAPETRVIPRNEGSRQNGAYVRGKNEIPRKLGMSHIGSSAATAQDSDRLNGDQIDGGSNEHIWRKTHMPGPEPTRNRPPSLAPVDDPSPRPLPDHAAIEGRYVRVEPLDVDAHAADLFAAGSGDIQKTRIWDFLPYGPFPAEAAMRAHLAEQAASSDPLFFAIRPNASGRAEGIASQMRIEPTHGVIEIGHIWLGPDLQQTPAATEALYLLISHAMDDLGYRRMEWKCDAANAASRAAAERLGFIHEGIFYQHLIVKRRNRDTAWFSILDSEWPAVRANIESWLDPANFDEKGKQRQSLGDLNRALTLSRTGG